MSTTTTTPTTTESSKCKETTTENAVQEEILQLDSIEEAGEIKDDEADKQNKGEESDEDIPGDFFDDFLKEDFMAGLDIVDDDAWDEDKIKIEEDIVKTSKEVKTSSNEKSVESDKKRKKQKSSKNKSPNLSNQEKTRGSKQKKKKSDEKEKDNSKRKRSSSNKEIDADEFDIRRDPEKTKRDIARDKVKCEKDKEMKIISEKLSLVETGLVPPGMEMEIDIEEVKRQKERIGTKSPRDLREHLKDLKEKNKSPTYRPKRRSLPRRSPLSSKRSSPPRRRSRSPRDSTHLTRNAASPARRSPLLKSSPRRSPLRRISPRKSPLRLSPRHRSSERIYGRRRSRSHSPLYRGRRGRFSPLRRRDRSTSKESDREKWLKRRHRSRSPRRKREEKKSFLQEIAEKLNEIRRDPVNMPPIQQLQPVQPMMPPMQPALRYIQTRPLSIPAPMPIPVPAPAPVPAPPNNASLFPIPQQQQYDPYDQNFFIGSTRPVMPNHFPQPNPVPSGPQMPLNPVSQPLNSPIVPPSSVIPNISVPLRNMERTPQKQLRPRPENQEDVAKLFQDKQITLSELLAITAKPEVFSSSPSHLQEKIKVITRCHDAIKILGSCEKKYSGRLVVQKTNKYKRPEGKYISPLKNEPPVQFAFTNPSAGADTQKNSFTNFINDLLQKMGLLNDTVVNVDLDEDMTDVIVVDGQEKAAPPLPPSIKPVKNSVANNVNKGWHNNFQNTNQLCKFVQTDVFKCESCEKRKKILHRSTAMQAGHTPVTFSISTQVTEEDFQPKIPKNQSLAVLTPAQLLAKSRESLNAVTRGSRLDSDNFDILSGFGNRPNNFFRHSDNYGLSRPALLPFSGPSSSLHESLHNQMLGGSRGRPFDPNIRFSHNNYF